MAQLVDAQLVRRNITLSSYVHGKELTSVLPMKEVMLYIEKELLGPQRAPLRVLIPMSILYSLILLAGVVGNAVMMWWILQKPRKHTGGVTYYLANLAVSGLISLVSGLPFEVQQLFVAYPYPFTQRFCQVRAFVSESASTCTVFMITVITIEKYITICRQPCRSCGTPNLSYPCFTIIGSWLLAFTLAIPMGLEYNIARFPYPSGVDYSWAANWAGQDIIESAVCTPRSDSVIGVLIPFSAMVFFFLPLLLIIVLQILIAKHLRTAPAYLTPRGRSSVVSENILIHRHNEESERYPVQAAQRKHYGKSFGLQTLVISAFFICYAPHQIQRLHAVYEKRWDTEHFFIHQLLTYISGLCYYGALTVNPLLYAILADIVPPQMVDCLGRDSLPGCDLAERLPAVMDGLSNACGRPTDLGLTATESGWDEENGER